MTTAIVPGSLAAIAKQENKSIAETFVRADCVVIVDTSGSMQQCDGRGGKTRYEVACEELKQLQAHHPGKIAVLAFSDQVAFCPSGIPVYFGGKTDMAKALQFAKLADVPGIQFVLISDGDPDDPNKTLEVAKTFKNKISTIYVGPEEREGGRLFLESLSALTGGSSTIAKISELKEKIELLLPAGL